jgi:hypothetical protein
MCLIATSAGRLAADGRCQMVSNSGGDGGDNNAATSDGDGGGGNPATSDDDGGDDNTQARHHFPSDPVVRSRLPHRIHATELMRWELDRAILRMTLRC